MPNNDSRGNDPGRNGNRRGLGCLGCKLLLIVLLVMLVGGGAVVYLNRGRLISYALTTVLGDQLPVGQAIAELPSAPPPPPPRERPAPKGGVDRGLPARSQPPPPAPTADSSDPPVASPTPLPPEPAPSEPTTATPLPPQPVPAQLSGRIAFTRNQYNSAGGHEIYTVALPAGQVLQVTGNGVVDWDPDWSPDGRWLLFTSFLGDNYDIWRMDAAGGGLAECHYLAGVG